MAELISRSNTAKATKPKIICFKHRNRKKYYCIKYFDVFTGEYCIGYGSYCKKFVKEWLRNEFVTVPEIDLDHYKECRCKESEIT